MSGSDMTESGLDDFSQFCPAESLSSEMEKLSDSKMKPGKVRSKVAWFSRKSKANSVAWTGEESFDQSCDKRPSGKKRKSRGKNRNSLPVEMLFPAKLETSTSGEEEEEQKAEGDVSSVVDRGTSPIDSPIMHLASLKKELDSLKGCVSQRRTVFSPSHSPDLCFFDNPEPHVSSLPIDKPFNILSSSDNVVFPLEEYSVHVAPFYHPNESCDTSHEKLVNSNGSCQDLFNNLSHDMSHDHSPAMQRQGSFEYDHLEEVLEDEKLIDNSRSHQIRKEGPGGYFVAVQFSAEENKNTIIDSAVTSRKSSFASVPEEVVTTQLAEPNTYKVPSHHTTLPSSVCQSTGLSYSIPGRLNSSSLNTLTDASSQKLHLWKSLSGLTSTVGNSKESCHCPSCCSCGSSQRKLVTSDSCDFKISPSVSHTRHISEDLSHFIKHPVCPLKRYGNFSSYHNTPTRRHKYSISPLVHNRVERVRSDGDRDKIFIPSVDTAQDDVETAHSCIYSANSAFADPETQSLSSLQSHVSIQSTATVNSTHSSNCCERQHVPYNKGVDVAVFKQRMDLITQWFSEFTDQQRNSMLHKLLEQCNCVQMHMLSVQMEPILHQSCPHNCQDLLTWLPPGIGSRILSFLDPVSLCRVSQVSRSWYTMANDPKLWKQLCLCPDWQLSPCGFSKQKQSFTNYDGSVQWKQMFVEMFRLKRNWLKGYCTVRTFEGHTQGISCVQFDDTRIVSGSWDKTIKVWNRRTNTAWAALTLAGHSGTVRCLHLHGNRLVSGSSDRTIKVWDLATNNVGWIGAACRATMIGHLHTVRCLQADDSKVVSGSYDHTLKVWDLKSGHCTMTLSGHTDAVLCLQFDKHKVISGSKDTTIKLWALKDGQCQLTLHGHEGAVTCLQFDDSRIISGALDRLIKIWNLVTGQCLHTMDWIKSEGHTGVVRHLQADSWKIVSAADDKTLKVWSVRSGERLLTLKSHTDGVTCLQFNDQVIVSGSYDKSVKLWDFSVC